MKRFLFFSVALFVFNVSYAQMFLPKGSSSISQGGQGTSSLKVGINTGTPEATLHIRDNSNPLIVLSTANTGGNKLQIGLASSSGIYAVGANRGDGVIRMLGEGKGLIFFMANDTKQGKNFVGISDSGNGLWAKFCNNKTLYVDGSIYAKLIKVVETIP